jgi:hypothetical protein
VASSHLIRLKPIKGKSGVLEALKHNKRTLQAERGACANIDVTRAPLNYCLASADTPENIAKHAKVQMVMAGIDTPRINQVMAVEIVFSLPIQWHSHDTSQFFKDSFEWVKNAFAGELLSFDIHLDESAPHAHAIILPLIDSKMQGNKMIGGTGNLYRLRNLFYNEVAYSYGLAKASRKRLNEKDKQGIERQVLKCLINDSAMQSSVWPCVRDAIHKDPFPFAQMLSIELEKPTSKSSKSFVDHKRSHGKGDFLR